MGLAISNQCNLGCQHCMHFQYSTNQGKSLTDYQKPSKALKMSWSTAKKCIDEFIRLRRRQGKNLIKIHFGNAEPLINWPVIAQILDYYRQQTDLTFDFAINTNLLLLTEEIAKSLKCHKVRIATSLDGTQLANDTIRRFKNGQGTFNEIIAKFDLLQAIDYPLDGFSITVTNDNFELINKDIIDLVTDKGMNKITYDYDLTSLLNIEPPAMVEKLISLRQYANSLNIDFFGTWDTAYRNLTSTHLTKDNQAFCAAVEGKNLEFNVDGSIKICNHSTTKIGHVDNLTQIFSIGSPLYCLTDKRFPGSDEFCFNCEIEGFCAGQCHVTREAVGRFAHDRENVLLFSHLCDFYRQITQKLAILDLISTRG